METTTIQGRRSGRSMTPLGRLTLAALLLTTLVFASLLLASGAVDLFGPHVAGALLLALLVGAGFRWSPGLAGFVMALLIVETLVFAGKDLTSPGSLASFSQIAILVAALVVGTCAGIGATVQSYQRATTERQAPAWLRTALTGVAALVAGAILTVAIQQPGTAAGVSPEALAALPAVTVRDFKYDQPELHARVGESVALRLDNDDTATHYFEIDELGVHATMPAGKSSLAVFHPTKAGTYTIYCTPHSDKNAHTGMVAKLVVSG